MADVSAYARQQIGEMRPELAIAVAVLASTALFLRLLGVNWDSGAALNPDARHLFNLASAAAPKFDALLSEGIGWGRLLFDPGISPLNPRSGGASYVYGDLPLTLLTLYGHLAGLERYADFVLAARVMAALAYALAVVAVCLSARVVGAGALATVLAGLLFATSPTVFQIAGFGAVDIWLVSAWAWSGLGLLMLTRGHATGGMAAATGVGIAVAMACKITALGLGLPSLVVLALLWRDDPVRALRVGVIGLGSALGAFRLLSPMSFDGLALPSADFIADLAELRSLNAADLFPPNWQWLIPVSAGDRLRDIVLFGTGPVLAVAAITGCIGRWTPSRFVLLALAAAPILHIIVAYNPVLRYGAPALPALAVLGAQGLHRWPRALALIAAALAVVWASGIVRLHLSEHSRISASLWLMSQPGPFLVVVESPWDDALPVGIPGLDRREDIATRTLILEAPPSAEKIDRIVDLASRADFIVSSSGRFSEVQPHLPDLFPVAARLFAGLHDGSFCLSPVWQSRPGYPLPGLTLDDTGVQEPWTVYDHPPVTIYSRTPCFDPEMIRAALTAALPASPAKAVD